MREREVGLKGWKGEGWGRGGGGRKGEEGGWGGKGGTVTAGNRAN